MARTPEEVQAIERRRDELLARREQIPREETALRLELKRVQRDQRATREHAHAELDAARERAREASVAGGVRASLAAGETLQAALVEQAFRTWSLATAPDGFWKLLHAAVDAPRGRGEQAFSEAPPSGRAAEIPAELALLDEERQANRRELDLLPRSAGTQIRPAAGRSATVYTEVA